MPWVEAELSGVPPTFLDSRAFALIEKVVPMSLVGLFRDQPTTLTVPMGFGTSMTTAVRKLTPALMSYALHGDSLGRVDSARMINAITARLAIDAERNGYVAEDVVAKATQKAAYEIRSHLYTEIAEGRVEGEKARRYFAALQRLGRTLKGTQQSVKLQNTYTNRAMPAGEKSRILNAWLSAKRPVSSGKVLTMNDLQK